MWMTVICPQGSALSSPGADSLPISALQHWLFCLRQCALIHVERLWAENWLTASGCILHERADAGDVNRRDGVRTLPLADRLCLSLINRRHLQPKDFQKQDTGGVFLRDDARKTVLEAWQEHKRATLRNAFLMKLFRLS